MTRATLCPRVLNILITLIAAPLGKTLKAFRNMTGATNIPAEHDFGDTLGKALISLFKKMV
ncbi:hypothetical protein A6V37_35665 [Paraburkholderia ginsengiterrae]|uniref:Uncharacterized protein n=1 Tax=Paraburkholderia ginsengiterrae TaxID=1462993 RepID=A0A1A9N169_9BURK|nr:hypothetical protein A6V37_35665 [Paraburkholderia ginsengiterrae]